MSLPTKWAIEEIRTLLTEELRPFVQDGGYRSEFFIGEGAYGKELDLSKPPTVIGVTVKMRRGDDESRISLEAHFRSEDYRRADYTRMKKSGPPDGVKAWKRQATVEHASVSRNSWGQTPAQALLSAKFNEQVALLGMRIEAILASMHDEVWEDIAPPKPTEMDKLDMRFKKGFMDSMLAKDMQEMLEGFEQPKSGSKGELFERLRDYVNTHGDHVAVEVYEDWLVNRYQWPEYFKSE